MLFSVLLVALSPASAQTVPAGSAIERAVSIQVTQDGLDNFGGILPAVVPSSVDIADVRSSGGTSGCFLSYEIELGNTAAGMGMEFGIAIDDVRFIPRTGILDLEVDLLVNLNDSGNPFDFNFEAACITGDCAGWVRPFPVTAGVPVQLAVAFRPDGTRYIDATVGAVSIDHGLNSSHIQLTDSCSGFQSLETVLAAVNLSFYDFIIGIVDPFIAGAVQDQVADIELQIEDALAAARYDDTLDLAGVQLDILVEPRDIDITPGGLVIDLLGSISADADACMTAVDPGGSALTDTLVPELSDNPAGSEVVIHVGDELVNQGLYSVWRSGLLCYEISEDSDIDVGFPIDSSLLSVFAGEAFDELIFETQPLVIVTDPRKTPTANYEGGYDVTAEVRELGVDFYTEIDYRQTRALGLTVEADAGIDIPFDGTTGVLGVDIALGPDNITIIASHNELTPAASEQIETSVANLLDVLLDTLVGDALDGFSVGLPAFEGVGLASADVGPTGDGDWMGIQATVGEVSYEGGGCDGDGCSGGTTGGCSSATGRLGVLMALLPLLVVRRRRS